MDISARLTSKGRLTVPKAVREALGLQTGDRVIFRVEGEQAALARTPDLIAVSFDRRIGRVGTITRVEP